MLAKEDIQTNLLDFQSKQGLVNPAQAAQGKQTTVASQYHINIADLGQYRIKSHCSYDSQSAGTTDFSIFQVEILDEKLRNFYEGSFLLEIWNKQGERLFQKVLHEEIPESQWELYNNVLVFKSTSEAQFINIIFLNEKKMTTVFHPYDDLKEVDLKYFDGYLIVAQSHSIRFLQIAASDVTTTIDNYQLDRNGGGMPAMPQTLIREFSGILQNERIVGLVFNHLRQELIFACASEQFQLSYYKLVINKGSDRRQLSLSKYESVIDAKGSKRAKLLEKKQTVGTSVPSDIAQLYFIASDNSPFLLVLRKNQQLELVYNFSETLLVESRMNIARILGCFGEAITYQFHDGSIAFAPSFERLSERNYLMDADYYRQLTFPPIGTVQHEIHRSLHFYQDSVIVNQTLFLVRDNTIFQVNTSNRKIVNIHFPLGGYSGSRIISLQKLRQQSDDENGFKITTFKVVAIHQNGMLQVYIPEDLSLMSKWQRTEITNTSMSQQRDPCHQTFQNQNASNYIYIVTVNHQANTQKIYQMMFNTSIIEFSNIKIQKGDNVFSVNSESRQRELLGIVDVKYLAIYKNDKGNLIKLYQINHTRFEIRDNINTNSVFYFQRDYALIITNQQVYKINIATNAINSIKLASPIQTGGSAFIDSSCFYFLTRQKGQNKSNTLSQLALADIGMIDAAFIDAQKGEQSAIVDKDEKKGQKTELMHSTFTYGGSLIKRMDYDDFNSVLNLQMANFEIIQVPLYHRNTMNFFGMAERPNYLCFKRQKDSLFALDRNNFISKWSTVTGELLQRTECRTGNYSNYNVDRGLYDRDWFSYTLIYQNDFDSQIEGQRINKIIKIDDKGQVVERLSFNHSVQRNQVQHLYFNTKLDRMIELLLSKGEAIYNEYSLDASKKWKHEKVLNQKENQLEQFIEWHLRSLYPFSINLHDFSQVNTERLRLKPTQDTFKFDKTGNKVKILNTQDGIEMVCNGRNGEVENYMSLQYSFTNTKASFYDKRCGQFYIQEVTSRLQNFFEYIRRQIYLENKAKNESSVDLKLQAVDVSANDYKHKYVIERSYTQMDLQFFKQFLSTKGDKEKEKKLLSIFKKMSGEHIQRLVHNVFPKDEDLFKDSQGADTFLHFLATFNHGFEVIDYIGKQAKSDSFVVPFLINLKRQTPLDITVQRRDHKETNSLIKLLQKAPMDHHSRLIAHLIPTLVGDMSIPQLDKYFDRRRFQTGVCKEINLLKIKISGDDEMRTVPTTLINDNRLAVETSLTTEKASEQSVSLECFDMPLIEESLIPKSEFEIQSRRTNDYEIKLVKSFASTDSIEIFQQKTVRAFIDFIWPKAKSHIIKSIFLPYLAFMLYFMLYLIVIKRLSIIQQEDEQFHAFVSKMFDGYDVYFKMILFLGCFYFLFQDFQQIKSLASNSIVIWSYANIVPLAILMFVVIWDKYIHVSEENQTTDPLQKSLYSLTAFLVWTRVVHLLKCFTHTSYLLRMATEILFKIRWLIAFIVISILSFGFTFYFVADYQKDGENFDAPQDGIRQMFYVLLGNYDVNTFENSYQSLLLVIVSCFNAFFIFTLLISLSVMTFTKGGNSGVWSNEAYQDKASLIGLYSYLLEEKAVRDPKKDYLLIATLVENRKKALKDQSSSQIGGGINSDPRIAQAKLMKNIDRRLNQLSTKVDRALREISEKVGAGAAGR